MFKRKDRFLAHDAFKIEDGRVVATIDRDSWDGLACKRLGINWDECLILEGMPVVTSTGEKLGAINSVEFDKHTRKALELKVTEGAASQAIIGSSDIPIDLIIGYKDGSIVAEPPAAKIKAEGGLAAKAGEQAAIATHAIKEKTKNVREAASTIGKKAGKSAGKAVDSGSKALGKQLGKTKGMFKAFKDEYKKEASKD
jgi:sporulation protein YlmC with PRC-barrel domain